MHNKKVSLGLVVGSLGVVFGDIGTSPLYAMRETLSGLSLSSLDILGVLSLIVWSLIIVISLKYLVLVFRADNDGEGGILALLALIKQKNTKRAGLFYLIAIFGAGLLLGDAMLTPAISVISAIEGLEMISSRFEDMVQVLSCIILFLVFAFQSWGTGKIGNAFGPILFVWFITIAILGVVQVIQYPYVLKAFHPYYAFEFLYDNGMKGFFLLGGVFLVVTGGEALYADMGAFGKDAIRISWFFVAFPCLILNYLGQGANLMQHPEAIANPFYALAPDWFFIPLLVISTLATVIASQAVISATFSLTKQAILLGLYPKIPIIQTSKAHAGQIYIPQMNVLLLIGTLMLVYVFENSAGLAHAYGIAVNLTMLMVTILVSYASIKVWNWSLPRSILVFSGFILVDLAFLGANSHKFLTGGWVPTGFALLVATVMHTWNSGLHYLKTNFYMKQESIFKIIKQLHYKSLNQLHGLTAIFITDTYDRSGGSFLHFLKLSMAVPENILIVNYVVENIPHVHLKNRFELQTLDHRICQLTLHYGFMDTIAIPKALGVLNEKQLLPFELQLDRATYLVEIPNIMASKTKKTLTFYWQEKLFVFLMRNYSANLNIEFYKLPHNRTIAIGTYCII
ncbi:potassium transporter Kup [Legionella sp. CNM-4043-24]|uniref:potassium transporter Kup n=1 Tax=Legionella sp. CNM-4043-24 TaxID=3421646 RepID=UPI00403A927B